MKNAEERIVTVGQFVWSRALLLQIILQDNGVSCFIVPKDTLSTDTYADIRVKESDIAKALRVIEHSVNLTGKAKEKAFKHITVLRRILVPVDFSDISLHACRFAVSLAEKYKAEVKLVHVFYNPAIEVSPYAEYYTYQNKLSENLLEIENAARESMLKLVHKVRMICIKNNYKNVKISSKFLNGFGADEIVEYGKKYKPFVIIMGTRGLAFDNNRAFGRITSKVIENANVPVLALPYKSVKSISDIHSILYATDFDISDYSALNRLIQMVMPFKINIHCVHFSFSRKKPWDTVKLEELQTHLRSEYKNVPISFHNIVGDNVINSLQTYIRNNHIDALAVTTHKRNMLEKIFIPSFSKKVYQSVGKPLLVFHAKK